MKKIVFISAILLTLGLVSFVQSSKMYVAINDFTRAEEVKPDRRDHTDNEVVINRISHPAPGYNIYVFNNQGGRFATYHFNRPSTMAFTEAMVAWRNDSTVDIRLQNGANETDYFALQVNGNTIGLWTETK